MCTKKFSDKKIQNCQFNGSNNKDNISFDKDLDNDYLGSLLPMPILSLSLFSISKFSIAQKSTKKNFGDMIREV